MQNLTYAGIGSRDTPESILKALFSIGAYMAFHGWILHSGGAKGADQAFQDGCESVKGPMRIFRPHQAMVSSEAYEIAAKFHPAWDRCSQYARLLHARNSYQVLGLDLKTPVRMVICYTKNGARQGGTGQALRIAKHYGVPIFDLGTDNLDIIQAIKDIVEP